MTRGVPTSPPGEPWRPSSAIANRVAPPPRAPTAPSPPPRGPRRRAPNCGPAHVALFRSGVAHAPAVAGALQRGLRERYVRIILDGLRPTRASALPGEPLDFVRLQHLKQRAQR